MKRLATAWALLAACSVLLAACGGGGIDAATAGTTPTAAVARVPDGDWAQFDYNAQRSGVGPADTGITGGSVGRLGVRKVVIDGIVDSSPIQLHDIRVRGRARDVVIATTTYGRTIALDPGTGAKLWEFVPNGIGLFDGSPQITNATPIADPDRRFVYAASPNGLIHKLVVATGREIRSGKWPVRVTFGAAHEKLPAPLNISGNSLIVVTGGYTGDAGPYQGHVLMINRSTGHITAVWNALCSNRHHLIVPPSSCPDFTTGGAAIWGRAGAVVEPGSGRILIATGNGPFNGSTDWGDSALELSADGRRLSQSWTPTDQASLEQGDTDVGSTDPALIPGLHLAVQGGKAGVLDLLDVNRLNGKSRRPGPRLGGELQQISTPGGAQMLTAPVVWSHRGRTYLFVADDSDTWGYVVGGGSRPRLHVAWQGGRGGTSPVLAGGLLYVYDENNAVVNVFEPTNGHLVGSLPVGSGHWNSPIVVGGRVVESVGNANNPTAHSVIYIYHLPGR